MGSIKTNARINHVHETALRIAYMINCRRFDELLKINKSYNIHYKNIQTVAIGLYKIKNN